MYKPGLVNPCLLGRGQSVCLGGCCFPVHPFVLRRERIRGRGRRGVGAVGLALALVFVVDLAIVVRVHLPFVAIRVVVVVGGSAVVAFAALGGRGLRIVPVVVRFVVIVFFVERRKIKGRRREETIGVFRRSRIVRKSRRIVVVFVVLRGVVWDWRRVTRRGRDRRGGGR